MDKVPTPSTCPTTLASLATIIEHLIAENMVLRQQLDDSVKTTLLGDHSLAEKNPCITSRPAANKD